MSETLTEICCLECKAKLEIVCPNGHDPLRSMDAARQDLRIPAVHTRTPRTDERPRQRSGPISDALIAFIRATGPQGATVADVARAHPGRTVGPALSNLVRDRRLARTGSPRCAVYLHPEFAAASTPSSHTTVKGILSPASASQRGGGR